MLRARTLTLSLLPLGLLLAAGGIVRGPSADDQAQQRRARAEERAIERTRKQVRMLDDLYKTAIVIVTTNYVSEESDVAAGDAFQALFKAMKDKGHHEIRLLDATGQPYDEDNAPKDEFEKAAVAKLKAGGVWHEEIVEQDGKKYLRAATPVPVVMQKCTLCHDHYAQVPAGQAIGAIGYKIAIE